MASSEFSNVTHMDPAATNDTPSLPHEPSPAATATDPALMDDSPDSQGLTDPPLHPGSPQWKTPSEWRQTHQATSVDYVDLYGTPAEEVSAAEATRGEWEDDRIEETGAEQGATGWGNDNGWGDEGRNEWGEVEPSTATDADPIPAPDHKTFDAWMGSLNKKKKKKG